MSEVDVLVIGAGMAGLMAARELRGAGCSVRVVDKGRGAGGRLATRRIGAATFDHGAQFLTARDPRFAAELEAWRQAGLLEAWGDAPADGAARWRGRPAMTAVAKHLASGLDVQLGRKVVAIGQVDSGWSVAFESGPAIAARAVLLTAPVPQALELLEPALGMALAPQLDPLAYEPCLVVMAVLARPSRIPAPGYLALSEGPVAWLADNQQKGISAVPAATIHASPVFSRTHWEQPRETAATLLLEAAAPWLGGTVLDHQVHGWRYARPASIAPRRCLLVSESPPLLLAGDAFGGPDVEGAALSGWAAAAAAVPLLASRAE